jgi:hypothetical protein
LVSSVTPTRSRPGGELTVFEAVGRARLRALFVTAGERDEAHLEVSLGRLPGVSRTNIVATLSPKGGCGKRTSTCLTGNVLASHLRLRALAVDLNPDFGTLADLAPDRARAPLSLVDLLRDKDAIASPGELRPYVSRLPSGLHLLAAPPDPAVMAQMTPELDGELLAFLRRFYEVSVTPRIAHTREALRCRAESPSLPVRGQNIDRARTELPRVG